ncbi:MAG TPA: NfeD family protein [Feifaniaceae bacterium]|nr:NfeD family protein [Feifaniaceae bacterium]
MDPMTITFILLGVGILLFVVEMFTPGIGISGGLGAVAFLAAVLLQIGNPEGMLFLAALILFIIAVVMLLFFRLAAKGRFDKTRIVLHDRIEGESTNIVETAYEKYLGQTGVSVTPLRPAGKARFGDAVLDVMTGGEFLPANASVTVQQVEGLRIRVGAAKEMEVNNE